MPEWAAGDPPDRLGLFLHHHNIQRRREESPTADPVHKLPTEQKKTVDKELLASVSVPVEKLTELLSCSYHEQTLWLHKVFYWLYKQSMEVKTKK